MTATLRAEDSEAGQCKLLSVQRISGDAPHSAFTDLVWWNNRWVCTFREATQHVGGPPDSRVCVMESSDGDTWQVAAKLQSEDGDIRAGKIAVMSDNRIVLLTAIGGKVDGNSFHQPLSFLSDDLTHWKGPTEVGDRNCWMWGITWNNGAGYSIGYGTDGPRYVRLYRTADGVNFESVVDNLDIPVAYPNESSITFAPDGRAYALLRCDPDEAFIGTALPPYTAWEWKQLDTRIGGPEMIMLPDGRLLAAGRLYDEPVRTSLIWIDPDAATARECLTLPSGGDTSYPSMVWRDDTLYMSYYASHEEKTAVYFARIKLSSSTR
jgi:hypothetical protein